MSTPSKSTQTGSSAVRAVSIPHKTLSTDFYRESVTVVIGTTKAQYTLHKGLLCFYSDFFRAALNGSFKEATERKVELPEVNIKVFEAFQVWLYTQSLPKNETVPTKIYPEWSLLVELWIFGDKYHIPLLQNNVADVMLVKVDSDAEVPLYVINHAYENTLSKSHLRKALVDIIAYRARMDSDDKTTVLDSHFTNAVPTWPQQACMEIMAEMDRGWQSRALRSKLPERAKCYYHVHADGEHC